MNGLKTFDVPAAHCTTGLKSANNPSELFVQTHTCRYQMFRLSSCFSFWPRSTGATESRGLAVFCHRANESIFREMTAREAVFFLDELAKSPHPLVFTSELLGEKLEAKLSLRDGDRRRIHADFTSASPQVYLR